jgi:hypothetical protein
LNDSGNLLLLAGVGHHVFDLLDHTGIIDAIGRKNIFPAQPVMTASMEAAIERANAWLGLNHGDRESGKEYKWEGDDIEGSKTA